MEPDRTLSRLGLIMRLNPQDIYVMAQNVNIIISSTHVLLTRVGASSLHIMKN